LTGKEHGFSKTTSFKLEILHKHGGGAIVLLDLFPYQNLCLIVAGIVQMDKSDLHFIMVGVA
jgi:hypothetical protein